MVLFHTLHGAIPPPGGGYGAYLLGWCFLQQTSPAGLRVKDSHRYMLPLPKSSTPSESRWPLTTNTQCLAFTYTHTHTHTHTHGGERG